MDIVSSPIYFILMVSTTVVQSQITKGPVNALKIVGDSVTLDCVTSRNNCGNVEWKKMEGAQSTKDVYRDGIGMLNRETFPPERYSVSSTGGCSLTITQLQINDSGRFSCSITVDGSENVRSSILVVINVTGEACLSNVTSNTLNQNDSYSFWTAINVPPKSLEPLSVILLFEKEDDNETETTDNYSQSQTFKTTLTGIAKNQNITRVCRVRLRPNNANGFDRFVATLDVCTTQQLIVSHPVENIAVSPPGPYHKDSKVTCTAKGYPPPTFKWTNLKTGQVVDGDTLVITGETGDKYNCTAMNTVKGKPTSLNITIEVSPPEPGCGPGCIGGIVGGGVAVVVIVVTLLVCCFVAWCPLYKKCCQ